MTRFSDSLLLAVLLAALAPSVNAADPTIVLNSQRIRLGVTGAPEWEWFAQDPPTALRLDLKFVARPNPHEATLFIRQDDVRQEWRVELNGHRLGNLYLMEADLVHYLVVPRSTLRDGENLLSLVPPKSNDDIVLHEVRLDPRPPAEALAEGSLSVTVTDGDGGALPSRITIVNARGALAPILTPTNSSVTLAARPGVVYTGDGQAKVGLPAGDYAVYASRGFEWSVATQGVHVGRGEVARVALALRHEVPTPGFVSCDTHVHTFTYSRHGDATMEERMLTLAGEGIELPIATDHNRHIDYAETARRVGVARYFTPVVGNEVTTPAGHFNIFPVQAEARVPDFKLTDWPRLMTAVRATPDVRLVVLNHPRNVHNEFQPFAATNFNAVSGENLRGPEFTFDAMELLNSSAQQTDYRLVFRDWFALLNHGYRITALGSSDSHDVSRYIAGQGRTYIACPDSDPGQLEVGTACSNLLAGRALVSMGLLVQMKVEEKFGVGAVATNLPAQVRVRIQVLGPSWVRATNVALYANGVSFRDQAIEAGSASGGSGVKADFLTTIPRPAHDVFLLAVATGPDMTAPFWAIPKPYQPTSPKWTGRVIAVTNPIWLDADGDGRFTAARGYAQRLVERHGTNPDRLLPALGSFDEATAAQAASVCAGKGADLRSASFRAAVAEAPAQVRRGMEAYAATLR